jgi:hypothetical protein
MENLNHREPLKKCEFSHFPPIIAAEAFYLKCERHRACCETARQSLN